MDLVLHLFQTNLIISIIILTVSLISWTLGSTTGYRWRKILWLILALRLIFPIPLNITDHFNFIKPIEITIPLPDSIANTTYDTDFALPASIMNVYGESFLSDTAILPDESAINNASTPDNSGLSASQCINDSNNASVNGTIQKSPVVWINIIIFGLFTIWLAGVIVLFFVRLIQYKRLKSDYLNGTTLCEDSSLISKMNSLCSELKIRTPICIVVRNNLKSPMLFGYFNTILFLPDISYSETELDSVLRHEITHYKQKDLWYKLIIMFACDLYWFNPILRIMKRMAYRDVECICDDKATKNMFLENKKVYCNSILRTMIGSRENNAAFTTRFAGSKRTAKQRLENILNSPNRKAGTVILGLILIILLLSTVCISFNITSKNGTPNNFNSELSSNDSEVLHNNIVHSSNSNNAVASTDSNYLTPNSSSSIEETTTNSSSDTSVITNTTEGTPNSNSTEETDSNLTGSTTNNKVTSTASSSETTAKAPTTNNTNNSTSNPAPTTAVSSQKISMSIDSELIDPLYTGEYTLASLEALHPNLEATSATFNSDDHFLATYKINNHTYETPTMFKQSSDVVVQAGKNHQVADLTDILNERGWLSQMKDSVRMTVSDENGRVYGVPMNYCFTYGIMCNTDLFKAAGLVDASGVPIMPTTWNELAQTAVKIKQTTGKAGFCLYPSAIHFMSIAYNFGSGSFFTSNGDGTFTSNIDSAGAIEAMKFVKSLKWDYDVLTADPVSEDYNTGHQHIANGTAAMYISAADSLDFTTSYGIAPDKLAMCAMPAGPSGHKYSYYGAGAFAFSADATPEQINVGLDLLEIKGEGPVLNQKTKERIELHYTNIYNGPTIASGIQIWKNTDILNYEQRVIDWYGNVNQAYYQSYFNAADTPGNLKTDYGSSDYSYHLYHILSGILEEVLTNPNADVDALMKSADEDFQWYINYYIYR